MLTTFQKAILGTLAAGFVLVALVISARGSAGSTGALTVSVPGFAAIPPGVITTGEGLVKVRPDVAVLSLAAVAQAATAGEAQAQVADRIARVIDRAKKLGVADRDIKHAGYRIEPQYVYDKGQPPRIVGYQATQQLSVTLRKVEEAGRALDALVGNDGSTTASVRFGLDDSKPSQADARRLAVEDARSKAEAMAKAAGVSLGRAISVSDLGLSGPVTSGSFQREAAAAAPTQIPVSDLDVVVHVQVQFEIAGP